MDNTPPGSLLAEARILVAPARLQASPGKQKRALLWNEPHGPKGRGKGEDLRDGPVSLSLPGQYIKPSQRVI